MCDPVSLSIAGLAVGTAASITSGVAQYQRAQTQAAFNERNAELAQRRGLDKELAYRKQAERQLGAQRAQLAKAGVRLDEGSSLVLLKDSVKAAEADALAIRFGAELESQNFEAQAALDRSAGTGALVGAGLSAGARALSGASDIAQIGPAAAPAAPVRSSFPSFY